MDQETLNIFLNSDATKDVLSRRYGEVAGTIASTPLSMRLKNTSFDGEASRGGTVKVYRLKTSISQSYGTARAAGEGDALQNNGVDIKIDTDREIIEEIEKKDLDRYGIDSLVAKRTANHPIAMGIELDTKYFVELQNNATVVSLTGSTTSEKVLDLIRNLESVQNENVDVVDREMMVLTLAPVWHDALLTYMYTIQNPAGQNVNYLHGVEVVSAPRQQFDAIVQVRGSIAQPVSVTPYEASRIPLSKAFAIELYFDYGTKAVMPDLIYAGALDGDISV